MQEVFASQLDPNSFTKKVSFILMVDNGPEQVMSWKKKDLDAISESYEFVEKKDNRLPRFIKK